MSKHLPSYIESLAAESGDLQAEILVGLVEATEAQTEAIKELTSTLASVLRRGWPPPNGEE